MHKNKAFGHRADFHDYRRPFMYHIILKKEEHTPLLCDIRQKPDVMGQVCPETKFLPAGRIVHEQLNLWLRRNPKIRVMNRAIMPDHVHLMLRVTDWLEHVLGVYIAYFTGACSAAINPQSKKENPNAFKQFFSTAFTDVLIDEREQRDVCFKYISDNPKRWLARRLFPEFFSSKLLLTTPSGQYELYGNLFLLQHPVRTVVRWSRSFSEEQWHDLCNKYNETIRSEGVLVSPFIHPNERDFRDKGIDGNAKLILISTNGLPEIFKPSGRYFSLCEEGRLLIVAPLQYQYRPDLKRGQAMNGNALAEELVKIRREEYRISRLPKR